MLSATCLAIDVLQFLNSIEFRFSSLKAFTCVSALERVFRQTTDHQFLAFLSPFKKVRALQGHWVQTFVRSKLPMS